MNIIVIDDGYRQGDDRTRINFVNKLSNFEDIGLHILKLPSNKDDIKIEKVLNAKPDIFFFIMYKPNIKERWSDVLFELDIPTVVLEEDHYESRFDGLVYSDSTILDWYKEKNISLLLRRHSYEERAPVPSVWLPFSANEEEFKPLWRPNSEKVNDIINKIGFAGSYTSKQTYYDVRRKAINTLSDAGLLDENYGRIYDGYAQYLRNHVSCLACTGGLLHTCLAKTFEIPLSGSALLTNKMDNADVLWGDKKCYFEYKDDCSDIVEIAEYILKDGKDVWDVRVNGLLRTMKYHTDHHRIKELYNILKALVEGKIIPRIWGQ